MKKKIRRMGKYSFTCPGCGEKQESVCQWQTASILYEFDFKSRGWEQKDIEGGELENWVCPGCGFILSENDFPIKSVF